MIFPITLEEARDYLKIATGEPFDESLREIVLGIVQFANKAYAVGYARGKEDAKNV